MSSQDGLVEKKFEGLQIKPFWRYLGSKLAKIDQNRPTFLDDSKNFRKKIFGSNDSKWSYSKNYDKSEIWRPSNFFLLPGQPGSTLRKFFEIFSKVGFEDLQKIFPFTRSLAQHLEIF